MMWSGVDSNCGGGGRRLSVTGSKAGVLGSDGSWDEDFSGLVCSEVPVPCDPVLTKFYD